MISEYGGKTPSIDSSAFIANTAVIIGDVFLEDEVSIYFGAVLRGDIMAIRVGKRSNIQENCTIHTSRDRVDAEVGEGVTVGHSAIIHGARVEDNCLIGMGSVIMDEAVIGEHSLVGARSLVTEGKCFPPRSLIIGSPAKVVRQLEEHEVIGIQKATDSYVEKLKVYRKSSILAQKLP